MPSTQSANCSKTTMDDFCDFRNYLAGLDVFGQETKKTTKKGKNEKDLYIHNNFDGIDSLHSAPGPDT